jgi:hypothetical protein
MSWRASELRNSGCGQNTSNGYCTSSTSVVQRMRTDASEKKTKHTVLWVVPSPKVTVTHLPIDGVCEYIEELTLCASIQRFSISCTLFRSPSPPMRDNGSKAGIWDLCDRRSIRTYSLATMEYGYCPAIYPFIDLLHDILHSRTWHERADRPFGALRTQCRFLGMQDT